MSTTAPDAGGSASFPSRNQIIAALVAIIVILVLVIVAVGGDEGSDDGGTSGAGGEVFLEPIGDATRDPFTESVAIPKAEATVTTGAPPREAEGDAIPSSVGSTPGLYGGTRNESSCNREQLIGFLEANPDKAAAWGGVLGIRIDQIRQYVEGLTPVVLVRDTRVTNHGFANGRATTVASVLQAGTAVLVDGFGVPRVKCGCGNPLTEPRAVRAPVYTGPRWPGFAPATTVVVVDAPDVINVLVLVDLESGEPFGRPTGTDGTGDVDAPGDGDTGPDGGLVTATAIAGSYAVEFEGDLSGPCQGWPTGTGTMTVDVSDDGGVFITLVLPSGVVNEYSGSYDPVSGAFTAPDVQFGRNPLSGTFVVDGGSVTISDGRRTTQNVQGVECVGGFRAEQSN